MKKKDDKSNKKEDPFSSSAEIFEDLFKEATQTFEKPKVGKPKQEPPKEASVPPPDRSKQIRAPKGFQTNTKATKKETQPRREEPKSRLPEKSAKKTSPLKIVLLVLLLAVLAGAVVNYSGVFDLSSLSDLVGLGKKEPVAPALKKQVPKAQIASRPAEKKSPETVAPVKREEVERKKIEPSAPVQGKEAVPRVETAKPTSPAQVPETGAIKAPMPAQPVQVKQEKPAPPAPPQQEIPKKDTQPIAAAQAPQAASPVSQPSPPPPPQAPSKAVKPEPLQQPAAQTTPSSVEPPPSPIDGSVRYPYSIYLGSYQTNELARKALSLHKEEGSPAYWSKVRLGDKGLWYRIYAGYFRTEAEAKDYISRRQLRDAEVKMTKYALLIGVFPTRAEADQKLSIMFDLGFPAYIIPEAQGRVRLCSGAFLTKEGAESALSELAAKGIKASAVER
jgi:hypothetical protein